jgi:hypothetical protein
LRLSQFSSRSCSCLASRQRKPPKFGPNISPSANDPMLLSRSSASRSTARRPRTTNGNVNSLLSPKPVPFCVYCPEPTKHSIEIELPEAGERLEGTAAYHSPLTSYVALWAFRGVGGGRSPAAYAHRQRSAALRAKTQQPYARGDW